MHHEDMDFSESSKGEEGAAIAFPLSNAWWDRDTTYSKTCCNFLFFLSQSPLSEYNIHHHP
jgi:hypothetical protein